MSGCWTKSLVRDIQHHGRLFLAGLLLAALLGGPLTMFLGQRYALGVGRTIAWSITNTLLGPAGIVTFLALNERLEARAGAQCEKSLSPPPIDGREIFEPADPYAAAIS